jgi:hypothetical protein
MVHGAVLAAAFGLPAVHQKISTQKLKRGDTNCTNPALRDGLQHLFDTRLKAAKESSPIKGYEKELSAFEPWVYSRKFDESWTLRALEEMLLLTKKRERYGGYKVISRLTSRIGRAGHLSQDKEQGVTRRRLNSVGQACPCRASGSR